ncbi:ferritin [Candidatus Woesearchaeota archaeon]|nr:MAG: ferritin [Candidatus Woesearchaeota archaeon]
MLEQINKELYSGYLYLSMAAYFESQNLNGMASWMKRQSAEEYSHAMKIFDFVNERGGRVLLEAIDKPKQEWKSALEVFKDAYEHEVEVTKSINALVDLAREENDKATEVFLQWFVQEQVEEESSVSEIVEKLKKIENHPGAIFMLDAHLGSRK